MSRCHCCTKCKKTVDVLKLKKNTIRNVFDNKKWYCHKQTLTPSYQAIDMTNVTAKYKLKKGVVYIKNCAISSNGKRECVSYLRATLPDGEKYAKFTVKPWIVPSIFVNKTNYWILDYSKEHLIVSAGNPKILQANCIRKPDSGQGLWILTNSRKRDNEIINKCLRKINELGINGDDMVDITHL